MPTVVTDAGFRGPWFRDVEQLGWHGVGRVRNRVRYCLQGSKQWSWTTRVFAQATGKATFLGYAQLSHKEPYGCGLYLIKKSHRGPGRPKKRRAQPQSHRERWRRDKREPWLLATSLPHSKRSAREIVHWYGLRMPIEETFRDAKSHRWGFALRYARSRCCERLQVLLLLNTLATLVYWLAGLYARAQGWQRHFQANTEREEPVLSVFFLGREVMRSHRFDVQIHDLLGVAERIPPLIRQQAQLI